MKEVFTIGRFYGETRREIQTDSFSIASLEDYEHSVVPNHTHQTAHFCFIVQGQYETKIKDKKLQCPPLTMLFHPAGTTHRDHFHSEGGRFVTISLAHGVDEQLLGEVNFPDYSIDFADSEISWLGQRIFRELDVGDELSPIVLEGMANELLVYAARNSEKSKKMPGWLGEARELIRDRCMEKISIAEIASIVGVHPIHLARTFRVFFLCSPGEYLRKCRTDYAANLLITSSHSLAEIALQSGFSDQSQFTRCFKNKMGITPKRFRESHRI